MFAVQYFKLALTFPLLTGAVPRDEIPKRQKFIDAVTWGLYIFFIVWTLATLVPEVVVNFKEEEISGILIILVILSKIFSAVLLIIAIVRLRHLIRGMGQQEFATREKLMMVHIILFVLLIVALIATRPLLLSLSNSVEID